MKIKILDGVICGGKRRKEGDIVDASERDAKYLINTKRAVLATKEKAAPAPAPAPNPGKGDK
jgi:hypothetical protein